MPRGKVKWFDPIKGYGFIGPGAGDNDVFVHMSAVRKAGLRTLSTDEVVEFEIETARSGRQSAVNLISLSSHSPASRPVSSGRPPPR